MKRVLGLLAFAMILSFGTGVTLSYAGDPAPAPAPAGDKDKKDSKDSKGGDHKGGDHKGDKK